MKKSTEDLGRDGSRSVSDPSSPRKAGGTSKLIAVDEAVRGVAQDATNIYWADQLDGALKKLAKE